ncbi:MAG TPA: glycoside hydrolase family 43 protein [Sphingobacteriaceae bacterium]
MRIRKHLTTILFFLATAVTQGQSHDSRIQLADPTVFYHSGTYYLYGTGSKPYNNGFIVYTSKNMKIWQGPSGAKTGYALAKGDSFGDAKFWAPQVFKYDNKFYMAYTANEHIAIASSHSPLGPFTQENKVNLIQGQKQIDPYVFIDDDGKKYLYHVIVANGGNRIFVARLNDDFSGVKKETLKECITATEEWENTENDKWSVTEGPTVIKEKDTYYMVYSANHFRSKDYAVGYATSKSPYGPWKKSEEGPIISRNNVGKNGIGHGDLIKDAKGKWKYVLHTHYSDTAIAPRLTGIVNAVFVNSKNKTEKLKVKPGSFRYLESGK